MTFYTIYAKIAQMSEHLSNGPNFAGLISDHEFGRNRLYGSLVTLRVSTDEDRLNYAAEQAVEYQMRMAHTYQDIASAFIDNGRVEDWLEHFIREDEHALWNMFEDLHTTDDEDPEDGWVYFEQMPDDQLRQLASEYATGVTTPQPVHSIHGYIAPEFTGSSAIRYGYGFKLDGAIQNYIETLPESAQQAYVRQLEIHHEVRIFSEQFNDIDTLLDFENSCDEAQYESLDDGELVVKLYEQQLNDKVLSEALVSYEKAKDDLIDVLDELPATSPVRVKKRHSLYTEARERVKELSFQFESLCEIIDGKYSDKQTASRMMAAVWRQDNRAYRNIVQMLSQTEMDLPIPVDTIVDVYAERYMGLDTSSDIFGGDSPSRQMIIGYYTDILDRVVERVKAIR